MTGCQNTITFICTVLILTHKALFTDGFVIPPYHYYGYMGGNYFPCNWGYSYCSHTPENYYSNGCGCGYDVAPCDPCGNGLPALPQWQSLRYPGVPGVPVVHPLSGLTNFPGLSHVSGLTSVSGIPSVPVFGSDSGSPNVPGLASGPVFGSDFGSPSVLNIASVPGSTSVHASQSVAREEKGQFGDGTTVLAKPVEEYGNVIESNGDVNGKGEDEQEEKKEAPTEEEGGEEDEEENHEEEEEEEEEEEDDDDEDYNGSDEVVE